DVHRVLEHRAVSLLLDVLEVIGGGAIHRVVLAHVAQPSRVLGEALARRGVAEPADFEMLGLEELGPGDQRDAGFAENFHRGVRCRREWSSVSTRPRYAPARAA